MQTYEDGPLRLIRVGPLGPFANNAYLIADVASGEAFLVDMPVDSGRALEAARDLRVVGVLLTHTHPDHWAEYDAVKAATGAPVLCHPAERIMPAEKIDRPLSDGDELPLGRLTVRAVHTPGHTPGSTCFLAGEGRPGGRRYLISGDTLFPGGPGHTDSPTTSGTRSAPSASGCTPCPTTPSSSPAMGKAPPSAAPGRSTPSSPPARTRRTCAETSSGSRRKDGVDGVAAVAYTS